MTVFRYAMNVVRKKINSSVPMQILMKFHRWMMEIFTRYPELYYRVYIAKACTALEYDKTKRKNWQKTNQTYVVQNLIILHRYSRSINIGKDIESYIKLALCALRPVSRFDWNHQTRGFELRHPPYLLSHSDNIYIYCFLCYCGFDYFSYFPLVKQCFHIMRRTLLCKQFALLCKFIPVFVIVTINKQSMLKGNSQK